MAKLARTIERIHPLDEKAMAAARLRQDSLTKPKGSLGRLEELSIQVAGIRGQAMPSLEHKAIVTMAADHGVTAQGVSLYPHEVTTQMVQNFLRGGAGINVLAQQVKARVVVVDMGVASDLELSKKVAYGTRDMTLGPAMSGDQALAAVEAGLEVLEQEAGKGLDIVGTGDMGIGNTTPSSAVTAAISGGPVTAVTGTGTGIDERQLAHKVEVIERALRVNQPDAKDALDVLAKVGGFEIGGLVGVMIGAAAHRIPIIIDGFVSGAAALIATVMAPQLSDYLIAGHVSAESGHRVALKYLGLKPVLDLDMRLGEGTGAVLAMFVVEAAVRALMQMATFSEAGVSTADDKEG